ncbi:hypothetical protein DMENIID0001_026670 [Sergentomyia squamirostris]
MSKVLISLSLIVIISSLPLKAQFFNNVIDATCEQYSQKTVKSSDECQYGVKVNNCGNLVCYKGRGEICGEDYVDEIRHGECAEGLICCGKCMGCDSEGCDQSICRPKRINSYRKRKDNLLPLLKLFNSIQLPQYENPINLYKKSRQ